MHRAFVRGPQETVPQDRSGGNFIHYSVKTITILTNYKTSLHYTVTLLVAENIFFKISYILRLFL